MVFATVGPASAQREPIHLILFRRLVIGFVSEETPGEMRGVWGADHSATGCVGAQSMAPASEPRTVSFAALACTADFGENSKK